MHYNIKVSEKDCVYWERTVSPQHAARRWERLGWLGWTAPGSAVACVCTGSAQDS